jgi:molybdate transport system substrate-binding protein
LGTPIRHLSFRIVAIVAIVSSVTLHAQNVKVMSSGAFAAAYKLLAPQYEKAAGAHLEIVWGPSMGTTPDAIPVRLARGETADVVVLARSALDNLVKQGAVVPGSQVDLARSRIGMAVRAGSAIPDIGSVDAFRKVLIQARSVAYSDSASGVYIASELFKRLGIEKEMAAKSRQIPAEPVGQVVARGEVEIGFQQMSELQPISGITIVGPIPEELQSITVFSAGVSSSGPSQEAGRALIRYLASPGACNAIRQTALDPVACPPTDNSSGNPNH